MDIHQLTRRASAVHAALTTTKAGELLALKDVRIYIPSRFAEHQLAVISNEIRIVGIFAIVVGNDYGVSNANAIMQITPTSTTTVDIEGDEYYEFFFQKGSVICPNVNLVQDNTFVYRIYDEIVAKGHIPWFLSYEDLAKLFTSSVYHGNMRLAPNNIPLEMITASISRNAKDRTKYYRHSIKSLDEQLKTPPAFIALRNVMLGATNTTARLMGAYFDDGLLSALVNPSESTEAMETLMRR